MSRRLKEVFTNTQYMLSFLETIEADPCERRGTLEIIVEEVSEDGTPWLQEALRNIKICHSREECQHYEVHVDPATGIGRIRIEGIEAVQHVAVLVNEDGTQMVSDDDVNITYFVNGEASDSDYATIYFSSTQGFDQQLRIINRRMPKTQLELFKILRDFEGNPMDGTMDMSFDVELIAPNGCGQIVTLNYENQFHYVVDDLTPGFYYVQEVEQSAFEVHYRLNLGSETTNQQFDLRGGHNELEIINTQRSDTSLTIEKYIRTGNNELCRPTRFEEFMIRVISSTQDQIYCLNEENNYCITLYGLEPGYYDISEVSQCSQYETSFIVNGHNEDCFAHVELNECEHAKVLVINTDVNAIPQMDQESPLRICKYIRRCDGCICKPDAKDSFRVMVSGCGMSETFILNSNNNYCVDIADLCSGVYEVCEVGCGDYNTTYIVNDDCERTSACIHIRECESNCVSIINEERNRGRVRVCKYVRNEYGELMKPQPSQCFNVSLSSYFCKRDFVLNAENDWCMCFDDLRMGSFEVREMDCSDYSVSYQVNCGKECPCARFFIDSCCDNEIKIINSVRKQTCGILKICKYEETDCMELVKPSQNEQFEIEVTGPCFSEVYNLTANNNWCVLLEGLNAGEYQIKEINACDYDVRYIVNHEEMEDAFVYMNECNQEVTIINHRHQSGHLKLSAIIRNCNKEYSTPMYGEEFEVLIESPQQCFTTILKASNGWCVILDQLAEGNYRIIQKDNMGYKVSYQFHGKENAFAKVSLGQNDEEIVIVNEEKDCSGNVTVTKYIEDENGELYKPCPQDEFIFELKGRCFTHTYRLHTRNDFCVYFDDLEEGLYEVKEIGEDYQACYRINGEFVENGAFTLGQEDVHIDIINRAHVEGLISIEKRIKRGNQLFVPDMNECFKFLLKGKNCREVYELNAENNFTVCLRDLPHQHFEIRELNAEYACYDVNGTLQDNGYILFEGHDMHITIINEEHLNGCMEINKMIENDDGTLSSPCRWESFEVVVESECYKQKVVLQADNDFCVQLFDLPRGHYEVYECNCEHGVSYRINDIPCENAIVDMLEDDVCVTVVNHPCTHGCIEFQGCMEENCDYIIPEKDDEFHLLIESEKQDMHVELNCGNDFRDCLCGLAPGNYTIRESSHQSIRFEIENQVFEDVVCIELNGEHVCVNMVKNVCQMANITITKYMRDEKGNNVCPNKDDHFDMVLLHNKERMCFTLHAQNNWTKCFMNQEKGSYELCEEGGHDVQYQIADHAPSHSGYFELKQHDVDIKVFNKILKKGILHIEAAIKDCDQDIRKPTHQQAFYMEIESRNMCKTFVLNEDNDWHQALELEAGMYTISEKENAEFEDVYYMINERKESSACIYVGDQEMHVCSVHVMKCHGGALEISKVVRDQCCNCFKRPNDDEEFEIDIRSRLYHQIISLNSVNKFKEKLIGLPAGSYEIKELNPKGCVNYIVNGNEETPYAIFDICENMNNVKVINESEPKDRGSIEICKLMKDKEGCYRYPDDSQSFWIQIKGEHGSSRVLLNKANHFYASIRNLADGYYEVLEESEHTNVQYVVNNAAPNERGLVHVMQNANTVNVINAMVDDKKGSLSLCKYIASSDGLLVKPTQGSYRIHVSSPGYDKIFVLEQSNQYCVDITDLNDGLYVVVEMDHEQVTYIVNGGSVVDYAIVEVKGNANQVQILNSSLPSTTGSITLAKYIRQDNRLIRPQGNERYVFHVSKPGFNELYTLDKSNDWMMTLSQLEDGDYVIVETTTTNRVSYIINGGSEVDQGVVSVRGNRNSVQIINEQMMQGGSILLDKYMQNEQGERTKPSDVNFVILLYVSKPGFGETYELNVGNNWRLLLENLEDGDYVINEIGNDNVTYIINGGSEVDRAIVPVRSNYNTVTIINASIRNKGSILLDKYMRNEGALVKPTDDFIIRMRTSKPGYNEIFELNARNNWRYQVNDLEDGVYVIDEIDNDYDVTYRINGGSEVNNAVVNVEGNMHNVTIINALRDDYGSIRIEKYIRNQNGELVRPPQNFSMRVHVSKPGYNEVFTLNNANDFTITLKDLMDGYYVLNEVDSQDEVTYIINGGSEVENGIVQVMKNANTVQMIDTQTMRFGSLFLTKLIRNANGAIIPPQDNEEFQVMIQGNGVQESVLLNRENNWSKTIHDLTQGEYQVKEVGVAGYTTSYIVDNGNEQSSANVYVTSTMHTVKIINAKGSAGAALEITKFIKQANGSLIRPVNGDVFTIEIYNEHTMRREVLNYGNQFTIRINDLENGTYNIREINNDQFITTYRVNGGTPTDSAIVMLHGVESQVVEVINERLGNQNTIEVFKYMLDASGNYLPPEAGQVFQFEIIGENVRETYDMNVGNDWHVTLTQYPSGTYQIKEVGSPYPVQYLINSPDLLDEAIFTTQPSMTYVVGIINKLPGVENGKLQIQKRMRDTNGNVTNPASNQSFVVHVVSDNFDQFVTLEQANNFMSVLTNLPYGNYTLEEMNGEYQVSYRINGGSEISNANITIQNDTMNDVVMINAEKSVVVHATHSGGLKFVIE